MLSCRHLWRIFMLTRSQKENIVLELVERFKRQKIAIFSDFHGVSVAKIRELRKQLKQKGAQYAVSKKTLLQRAMKSAGIDLDVKTLEGEIGVTFIYEEDVEPVKSLARFGKENETFKNRAGLMGIRVMGMTDVAALAKLPTRDILLAQVLRAMQEPLRGLINVLRGNMRNLVVVLNKIKEKTSE